jgi:Cysteine-rich secretory protein family
MPRPRLVTVAALAALALCAPATASADDCAGADVVPAADNVAVVGRATLCLLNQQRAAHGLGAVAENAALSSASTSYSQRMVGQGFFAHESPDGGTLVDRLTGAGYLGRDDAWVVGENIGWGQAALATARSMVSAWMASPGHRANLLSGDYTEVGLGLALGTPVDRTWGATYTTDFGTGAPAPATAHARAEASAVRKKASRHATCARAASTRRSGRSAKPRSSAACARAARVRRR